MDSVRRWVQQAERDQGRRRVGGALVEVAVVAPGGLEYGAGDAVLEQPVAQGAAAGLGVVELALEAGVEEVGVELRLADIDAGDDNGGGASHSCVPVLLRFGASPTLPFRARRNCCDGPTKLPHGPGIRGRKRSDPPAASLRWGREGSATCRSGGLRHLRPWGEGIRDNGGHPSLPGTSPR